MLKVLLPVLFGDTDNVAQARLAQALSATDGICVTTLPEPLPPEDVLPDGKISIPLTEEIGAEYLRNEDAHIMMWGEILPSEHVIRLRFYTRPDLSNAENSSKLEDWLDLPLEMPASVGKALAAATAAAAVFGMDQGDYSPFALAAKLFPDMHALVEDSPELLPRAGLQTLLYFVFRMRKLFYYISDETSDLAAAMGACHPLMEATQEDNPQAFARVTKEYGDLMLEFEDPDEDPEYLDTALKSYDLARHIYDRDEQLEKWADVTYRMGYVLGRIGWNRGEPGASEAAIEYFENALSILTKKNAKRQWVEIITATGRVYKDLGRMKRDVDWYWKGIRVLESALAEVRHDEDPEEWETLTLHLGSRLAFIGDETQTLEPNQRAVRVLKAALTALDRETDPDGWSEAKNSLGTALQFVGEELKDSQTLQNAIAAYTDALTVRTRGTHPTYWADTINNMGNGYRKLGEVSGDAGAFEQAVSALEKALTVRTREADPFNWASSMNNLALAHAAAGKQSGDAERIRRAISIFQEVLDEAEENYPNLAHAVRNNMGLTEKILSDI